MTISQYLTALNTQYQTGFSREHSYRPDLQNLLKNLLPPDVLVTNEPARINCGAPDYILTRIEIPIGYIEAKDIGTDLNAKAHQEQFSRYKTSLANLIITDYLWFRFYKDGVLVAETTIGKLENGKIAPLPHHFSTFTTLIQNFAQTISQTITSPAKLAQLMASRAKLMANVIETALNNDDEHHKTSPLKAQMLSFKKLLIHDIENRQFADLYAQTIAYGMFAARYHDPTLPTFSRHEAATLIPKTNPFLRKLFQDIAGYDLDERLTWIVDELVQIFLASDVADIMKNFGQTTRQEDPVIHFYETFLSEYDPKLRKARGVWYTPQPVVNFIVRAVDDILKTEFNLPDGIAHTGKTKIPVTLQGKNTQQEVHKVQILDPATGTGTFLAQIIKHIHHKFAGQQGIWSSYAQNHLIPRLNGFELLMASYAMAHLKLDMLLTETGYRPTGNQRLRVFLTNSLEEYHPDTGTLFSSWLSDEANQANLIKRDTPVMVVIGNPPYSGESANKSNWIMSLMEDYKREPGGKTKLNEKNPKWINDDYVKFLRFAQYFIEKNDAGIIAFINPHGYLDNPTFRGMRWNLLKTFDKIYTIDLHGNSKKKETAPDGSPDVNVFDIQQGVSINLFIKTGKKKPNELGKVFHFDLYGQRELKYNFLLQNTFQTIQFQELKPESPAYFFVPKNTGLQAIYEQGFAINKLFPVNSVGVVTARDGFTIHHKPESVKETITQFLSLNTEAARIKFDLGNDVRDWSIDMAKKDLLNSGPNFNLIVPIAYRPFDNRYTYYTGKSKGFHCMPRGEVMQHFIKGENVGLCLCKQFKAGETWQHSFVNGSIMESSFVSNKTSEITSVFPLYLYPETAGGQQSMEQTTQRAPNLNTAIVQQIAVGLGLTFTNEKETTQNTFAPIDILDYIYAVLHSPAYREKYKEFLKIDFPRVPYPTNPTTFWQLVQLGSQLRQIHLLESPVVSAYITQYPLQGTNEVTKLSYQNGKVFINPTQYFAGVPPTAWEFYIGGYQPAQKWLKDRKSRTLTFEDIMHYQKIIAALQATHLLMQEIDEVGGK
ncbi:MAG TPA: N-6 DNA methylase [Chitinophagales bacterium]|nr:N-6 DNA methylase [Chitinophagales bacterium]